MDFYRIVQTSSLKIQAIDLSSIQFFKLPVEGMHA